MLFRFTLNTIGNFFIITGLGISVFAYFPILYKEVGYRLNPPIQSNYITIDDHKEIIEDEQDVDEGDSDIAPILPVSNEFAVIIPKIGVNAPVKKNVSTVNEREYMDALREGVAHAVGTSLPGENGNVFLFAHSSLNFWQLGPYATVFNLLNKLDNEDVVIVVHDNRSYIYKVFSTEVIPGWDTKPFYEEYDTSVVTLVTCYPPGATLNRFVVKAKLVRELSSNESMYALSD